ncbi:MAG: helix-turn-helix domain-containing protein [Treponema sp.]|nr:helix-turn-helix domain-containing protein [Treponema sp.]
MNSSGEVLSEKLLYQSENEIFHDSYSKELSFYNAVKTGDFKTVEKLYSPLGNSGMGKLSENPLNNMRYHFIVSVAMITRFCMEGGMATEAAYTLSDLYIQKCDKLHSAESIITLHKEMIFDFAERMKKIKEHSESKTVSIAKDFINNHLREPIVLADIAKAARISSNYLSSLFKKTTGETITNYIHRCRIEEAKEMLKYTDEEFIYISDYLCFSSHSHFISIFKKFEGMTPKAYRDKFYHKHFNESKIKKEK